MTNPSMNPCFFSTRLPAMLHLQPIKVFGFIVPAPGSKQTFLFGAIFLFKLCKYKLSSPVFGQKPTWWFHVMGHCSFHRAQLGRCCQELLRNAHKSSFASEQTFAHTSKPLSLSVSFSSSSWGKAELEKMSGDVRKGIKI